MTTWWNNTKNIEAYLSGNLPPEDALLFKARLLMDPVLRLNVAVQANTYALIRLFARRKMKSELNIIHQNLFRDPSKNAFRKQILELFSQP
jgi:hypothetical protein